MRDIAFRSAAKLVAMVQRREISSEELLQLYLDRVRRFNPDLNAIVVMDVKRARTRAREADAAIARGESWGKLHGLPMTIKESYNVAGLPTTFGNPAFKNNIAARDALAVQRLKRAGVVLFGKTNVIYGTTNNPWNKTRSMTGLPVPPQPLADITVPVRRSPRSELCSL